jgi:glycosyltransferase involved in cell wall biosynthesis
VKYSVCITHRNNLGTLKDSLDSLLGQLNDDFEIVVVDGLSDDGSEKILSNYESKGLIKLIRRRSSRGQGRQIAFENSNGEYVIANVDMDDIFRPNLSQLLEFYHGKCEGKVLAAISKPGAWGPNVSISTRESLVEVGGWRDLQYAEDWDLWSRAAMLSIYAWTVFPLCEGHESRKAINSNFGKLRYRVVRYRDEMRLGRKVFAPGENVTLTQRFAKFLAWLSLPFHTSFRSDFNSRFDSSDPAYFIS